MSSPIESYDSVLPKPGFEIDPDRVAVVITDPQIDFLSPSGVAWGVVGDSVTENDTVDKLDQVLAAAHDAEVPVFVSPHYYYPHDHGWRFGGALEELMHQIGMFDRRGPLTVDGFAGSGADWQPELRRHIEDDRTTVVSPHKVYGPESNDLVLQLRKRGIDQVILAGMSANLCVEAHLRELAEQGFQVAAVYDATAAAQLPGGDGYAAACLNFRMIASATPTTSEIVDTLGALRSSRAAA